MRRHSKPYSIKLIPGPPDAYGNTLAAIAICACGQEAQLPHEWIKLAGMFPQDKDRQRARLRCSKCGRRMPRVEVYSVRE